MEPGGATPLYGLDIETDTTVDGLDPSIGRVLAVAVVRDQPSAEATDSSGCDVFADADEAQLLARLDRHLAHLAPGVLVTWNGARFDLPYLATRAELLGVPLGLHLALDPSRTSHHDPLPGHVGSYRASWYGHDHLDVYRVYRADLGPALHVPCSLKAVAALAGLAPIEVDASRVHDLSAAEVAAYVASDARCTAALARRRWPTAGLAADGLVRSRAAAAVPPVTEGSMIGVLR